MYRKVNEKFIKTSLEPGYKILWHTKDATISMVDNHGGPLYWNNEDDKKLISFLKNETHFLELASILANNSYTDTDLGIKPFFPMDTDIIGYEFIKK